VLIHFKQKNGGGDVLPEHDGVTAEFAHMYANVQLTALLTGVLEGETKPEGLETENLLATAAGSALHIGMLIERYRNETGILSADIDNIVI